jgi:hypothetical protein
MRAQPVEQDRAPHTSERGRQAKRGNQLKQPREMINETTTKINRKKTTCLHPVYDDTVEKSKTGSVA